MVSKRIAAGALVVGMVALGACEPTGPQNGGAAPGGGAGETDTQTAPRTTTPTAPETAPPRATTRRRSRRSARCRSGSSPLAGGSRS